ncbi:uncharacterized protein LOC113280481 [Papaver somniferum]|uniref:uncharacterized protein LOC113280481 n=1 Tax=Papaver somniferum TaxID=3469 RepID=UPI000E7045DB|nr:uncharacterized protein LOC113280481 [Papaver somniferum]
MMRGGRREEKEENLNQEVLDELRDTRTLINNSRRGGRVQMTEAIKEAAKSPFTYEIMYVDIPEKCVLPTLPSIFSGSESVMQHLKQYILSLIQWGRNDEVLCRYFPASLTGEALAWFDGQPERSISSFKDLQRIFLTTYITNNMLRPGIETLFNLRRRSSEILRGLVTRWRMVCSELAGRVDEKNFILAFVNALIPNDLLYTQIFIIRNSLTMNELREYQEEYIVLEEKHRQVSEIVSIPAKEGNSRLLPREVHVVENDPKHKKGEPSTPIPAKLVDVSSGNQEWIDQQRYEESRRRNYDPRSYITGYQQRNNQGPRFGERRPSAPAFEDINLPRLNATVEKVWEAIVLTEEIPPPPNFGRKPPPGTRSHEFCKYHRFHGHHTNNCRNIRQIILRLIEQGKLVHFLENYAPPPPPPPRENQPVYRIEIDRGAQRPNCNTIIHAAKSIQNFHDNILRRVYKRDFEGKEIFSVNTKEPLEEWQKRKITFSAKDAPEGGNSHTNPLVITLNFGKYSKWEDDQAEKGKIWAIDRILVDTGSSVDILFYHAFKTMGYKDSDLVPSTYNIYGFNGIASKPKRELVIIFFAGGLETKVTVCIIDIDSPYDTLIERPWIHGIKGIVSTYHQAIQFPMPSAIGEIRGDFRDAQDCIKKDVHNCKEKKKDVHNCKEKIRKKNRADYGIHNWDK